MVYLPPIAKGFPGGAAEASLEDSPVRSFTLGSIGLGGGGLWDVLARSFGDLEPDLYAHKREQVAWLKKRIPGEADLLDRTLVAQYAAPVPIAVPLAVRVQLSREDRAAFAALRPRRRRAIARFHLKWLPDKWRVVRMFIPGGFTQNVETGDYRSLPRFFAEADEELTSSEPFRALLVAVARMVEEMRPGASKIELTMHQMRTYAWRGSPGNNAPEGIHQDGADFVIPAIVIERKSIRGGESRVFWKGGGEPIYRRVLEPGEGLFHADAGSPLWHSVSDIETEPGADEGYRSILGFDIHVVGMAGRIGSRGLLAQHRG